MVQNIINPLMLTFVTDKLCDDLLFTKKNKMHIKTYQIRKRLRRITLKQANFYYYFFDKTKQEQIKMGVFSNFSKSLIVNYKNKQTSS